DVIRPACDQHPDPNPFNGYYTVGNRGTPPDGDSTFCDNREDVACALHLESEIWKQACQAHYSEQSRERPAAISMRKELRLGDVTEASTQRRQSRGQKVPGNETNGSIGEHVKGGTPARVCPAWSAQECEGTEDGGSHDEVEHHGAQSSVARDITFGSVRCASS